MMRIASVFPSFGTNAQTLTGNGGQDEIVRYKARRQVEVRLDEVGRVYRELRVLHRPGIDPDGAVTALIARHSEHGLAVPYRPRQLVRLRKGSRGNRTTRSTR